MSSSFSQRDLECFISNIEEPDIAEYNALHGRGVKMKNKSSEEEVPHLSWAFDELRRGEGITPREELEWLINDILSAEIHEEKPKSKNSTIMLLECEDTDIGRAGASSCRRTKFEALSECGGSASIGQSYSVGESYNPGIAGALSCRRTKPEALSECGDSMDMENVTNLDANSSALLANIFTASVEKGKSKKGGKRVLIDSCADHSIVDDIELMMWDKRVDVSHERRYMKGIVANSRSQLMTRAPLIKPFDDIDAYFAPGTENIISLDHLERHYDIAFAGHSELNNRRMIGVHNISGEVIECPKDKNNKNFYVYKWSEDQPDIETYCIMRSDSDLTKAQKLGLSKTRAVRAIEAEAFHRSLSHISPAVLKKIVKEKAIEGLKLDVQDIDNWVNFLPCPGCEIGKRIREDHRISPEAPLKVANRIGELVHIDVFHINSNRPESAVVRGEIVEHLNKLPEFKFLCAIDDYSGLVHTKLLVKTDAISVAKAVKELKDDYDKKGYTLSSIKRDNGGSMPSIDALVNKYDIDVIPCTAGRHVRVVERCIRHIKEMFRATIFNLPYILPTELYPNLVTYVTGSINMSINVNNDYRTPLHLFTKEFPRFHDYCRADFGQLVATYNIVDPSMKRDDSPRADVGIIIGRDIAKPGNFLVKDVKTGQIKSRHDVIAVGWNNNLLRGFYERNKKEKGAADKIYFVLGDYTIDEPIDQTDKRNVFERDIRLPEYDELNPEDDDIIVDMLTVNDLDQDMYITAMNLSLGKARSKYGDEIAAEAARKEIKAMLDHSVWEYVLKNDMSVDLSKVITSQMFLREKFDANNDLDEIKARLIGHGNRQYFIDASGGKTSSPTVSMNSVLAGISVAAKNKDHEIAVFDVKHAYLNAELSDPDGQLMYLPKDVVEILLHDDPILKDYVQDDGRILVRLRKALYGLKTAGRDWFNNVKETLINCGYKQSQVDKCIFYGNGITIFTYVDDFLTIGEPTAINAFRDNMTRAYGKLKEKRGSEVMYLGMNIKRMRNGDITVDQKGYIEQLLSDYQVDGNESKYPACANLMHESENHDVVDEKDYLSLVMKIMFIATRSRPDILFATVTLASRSTTHLAVDYDRLIKILRYLNGTRDKGLRYHNAGKIKLRMFVDAGFQTHRDAKGHTGFIIFPDELSAGVLFKCKKQGSVSQSSTEAELISLHEGVTYLKWLSSIYEELGHATKPIEVYEDNKSTMMLAGAEQVTYKGRSKFIDRKYFGIYQHIEDGSIKLVHVGTENQIADFFTKVIIGSKFERMRYSIMGDESISK